MKWSGIDVMLTSPDPQRFMDLTGRSGVKILNIEPVSALQLRMRIRHWELRRLQRMIGRSDQLEQIGEDSRLSQLLAVLKRRLILEAVCLFLLFMTLWLPTRVLFVAVEGNSRLTDQQILQAAEQCGIRFGANRRAIRSEQIKNDLLNSEPGLSWACVNTKGCVAILSVREKPSGEGGSKPVAEASVIAVRDGVIQSVTVTAGEPLCTVGQAVKKGQTLIGGRKALGPFAVGCRAEGEVYARTERKITVISPESYEQKTPEGSWNVKYSLILGKKRINLSKDSGISYTCCDKIVRNYYLTLPGGFVIPLALSVERWKDFGSYRTSVGREAAISMMEEQADRYVSEQMISGRVERKERSHSGSEENSFCVGITYTCLEMIGREQRLNATTDYGEDYGTNR